MHYSPRLSKPANWNPNPGQAPDQRQEQADWSDWEYAWTGGRQLIHFRYYTAANPNEPFRESWFRPEDFHQEMKTTRDLELSRAMQGHFHGDPTFAAAVMAADF